MKSLNNYYNKLYKQTTKVTRKLFGKDVTGCLAMRYELKRNIEQVIAKPIEEITDDDIRKNKLSYIVAKYRTLDAILEILERACTLKTFTIEGFENER